MKKKICAFLILCIVAALIHIGAGNAYVLNAKQHSSLPFNEGSGTSIITASEMEALAVVRGNEERTAEYENGREVKDREMIRLEGALCQELRGSVPYCLLTGNSLFDCHETPPFYKGLISYIYFKNRL